MKPVSPEAQLSGFIAKFTPEIARRTKTILLAMRALLPGAVELVYDNYNALAIGFGPNERTSEAIFSIAVYPRWVSLFFMRGVALDDPFKVLQGKGKQVRHIVLRAAGDLKLPAIRDLMARSLALAETRIEPGAHAYIVIKSISGNRRSRRPSA